MTKENLSNSFEDIENNSEQIKSPKGLCVHDLTQRLKEKQRKENINKIKILLIIIFFISLLSIALSKNF